MVGLRALPEGAASGVLPAGLAFFREDDAVFSAMLDGWRAQRVGGRGVRFETTETSVRIVERFRQHAGEYPWGWSAGMFDEWMVDLMATRRLAPSTIRGMQNAVRLFCDYVCSPHYGWAKECETRFGSHPIQVCHEWNTTRHLQDYEGRPGRRPLTRGELLRLFDHADDEVARRLESRRKGTFSAYRDATLMKVAYAWGLRASEAVGLDITDFYRNPHATQFGQFGMLHVRNGKASRGGAPKRRNVASLFGWATEALQDYVENIWPLVRDPKSGALWMSERGTRMRAKDLSSRFAEYRDGANLDSMLTPHALRHSYVTHLTEDGVDPAFIQQQVGHAYQSTTAIYTAVSGDFANQMMRRAIGSILDAATERGPK